MDKKTQKIIILKTLWRKKNINYNYKNTVTDGRTDGRTDGHTISITYPSILGTMSRSILWTRSGSILGSTSTMSRSILWTRSGSILWTRSGLILGSTSSTSITMSWSILCSTSSTISRSILWTRADTCPVFFGTVGVGWKILLLCWRTFRLIINPFFL